MNNNLLLPRLGAHISIAGGVHTAFERGTSVGCRSMQIFTRNQTQWRSRPLIDKEVLSFRTAAAESDIRPILAHDSYLINLASPDEAKWQQSCEAFEDEIARAERLGLDYLVFHPGAHMGSGEDAGIARIAEALNRAIDHTKLQKLRLLIETTAGQGTTLGYRFEHLADLIHRVENSERLGVCLDTCHIFAAGYDLRTPDTYEETVAAFERVVGLQWLKALHLNDSKKELRSRVDRHEDIGKGFIGEKGFSMVLNDPRFSGLAMVVETPGEESDHQRNLLILKALMNQ